MTTNKWVVNPKLSLLSSVLERNTLDIVVVGSIPTGGNVLVPGRKIMESKVLVAQWSAHASSKGKDDWFESIRAPQASLAQSAEHRTFNPKVVGSIPTGGILSLFQDVK